jgi:hypothetical protein
MNSEEQVILIIAAIGGVFLLARLAIQAIICWYLAGCYRAIPEEHRLMQPGMVWLLMIPCFPLVWNFFVYPRLSKSYKAYFDAQGVTDVGDCSEQLAVAYAICVACTLLPGVGAAGVIASLVLLIIYLVKVSELKNRILGR